MWWRFTAITAALVAAGVAPNSYANALPVVGDLDKLDVGDGLGAVGTASSPTESYWSWFYRWHRGGAFVFHDALHPCHLPNQTCVISDAKDLRRDVLHVNTTIVKQRDFLQVTYDLGDDDARDGDFIGVYCVDQDEGHRHVNASDFFDYLPVNATQEDSFRGAFVVGPLVNMRCSYQFRYLRHTAKLEYKTVAESAHVEMERGHTEPVQIHLALTETVGEMRVTWTSGKSAHQHVHYGATRTNLTHHTEATTQTYDASDMCSEPATTRAARWFRHPGYMHEGVMKDLVPGEMYYYTVGSKFGIVSDPIAFAYPPAPGSQPKMDRSQSVFVFGDLGQGVLTKLPPGHASERHYTQLGFESRPSATSNQTVLQRIQQDLADDADGQYIGVVHVGDLSYAKGRTFVWDQFGALIEPIASHLPYMVAIGNHEYDYTSGGHGHDLSGSGVGDLNGWHPREGNFGNDSKGECGVPTVKRFHMPENGKPPFWYSFRLGLTHHIVLSSEHNASVHAPMHKWLVHELKHNVNRTTTPWLVVHLHRPLYCSENFGGDYHVSLLLRERLERLFMDHHVDIVFSGHYHAYERTCPVYQEACRVENARANAPTHIMIGSGGAELDDINYLEDQGVDKDDDDDDDDATKPPPIPWSSNRQQEYGYGRLHVYNASHAHFEFLRTRDRVVSDNVWIVSDHNWSVPKRGSSVS